VAEQNHEKNSQTKDISALIKRISHIMSSIILLLGGVFLLLAGTVDAFVYILDVLVATIFASISLAFLASGIMQKNPISIWLAVFLFIPVLVEVLVLTTNTTYSQLYPLYIAMPFFASLISTIIWRKFNPHIVPMIFFGSLAAIFTLQATGVASPLIVGLLAGGFIAASILVIYILITRKNT